MMQIESSLSTFVWAISHEIKKTDIEDRRKFTGANCNVEFTHGSGPTARAALENKTHPLFKPRCTASGPDAHRIAVSAAIS
jgi:hypothetical protein